MQLRSCRGDGPLGRATVAREIGDTLTLARAAGVARGGELLWVCQRQCARENDCPPDEVGPTFEYETSTFTEKI